MTLGEEVERTRKVEGAKAAVWGQVVADVVAYAANQIARLLFVAIVGGMILVILNGVLR